MKILAMGALSLAALVATSGTAQAQFWKKNPPKTSSSSSGSTSSGNTSSTSSGTSSGTTSSSSGSTSSGSPASVPEPGTLALFAMSAAGLVATRRLRRRGRA